MVLNADWKLLRRGNLGGNARLSDVMSEADSSTNYHRGHVWTGCGSIRTVSIASALNYRRRSTEYILRHTIFGRLLWRQLWLALNPEVDPAL